MKQNWRKGDLFRIDWEKLIASYKGNSRFVMEGKAYQCERQKKFGDRVWEAVRVEHRNVLIHEQEFNGVVGWTGMDIKYVIPVKKGKP